VTDVSCLDQSAVGDEQRTVKSQLPGKDTETV
jgi:hypothetical protein